MNCQQVQENLPLYLYGEVSFDDESAMELHLESCPTCRLQEQKLSQMHRDLRDFELTPSLEMLAQSRQRLRAELGAMQSNRTQAWWHRLLPFAIADGRNWFSPAWQVAAGALIGVAGFLGGQAYVNRPSAVPLEIAERGEARNGTPKGIVSTAGGSAADDSSLAEIRPDPSRRISQILPLDDGRVEVIWEEVQPRVTRGRRDQEEIQRLLVAAAAGADQDPGVRVESVEMLKDHCEDRQVRRTLLQVAHQDASEAVRLRAVQALRSFYDDAEVRAGLNQVLLRDASANVRTLAIDVLVNHAGQDREVTGILQEVMRRERNPYIRERSQGALRAMKASLDTF